MKKPCVKKFNGSKFKDLSLNGHHYDLNFFSNSGIYIRDMRFYNDGQTLVVTVTIDWLLHEDHHSFSGSLAKEFAECYGEEWQQFFPRKIIMKYIEP